MDDHKRTLKAVDRISLEDCIADLFRAADSKDWRGVRMAFSKEVDYDMSSLTGLEPKTLTPGEIAEEWESRLAGCPHTHHIVSNFHIELEIYTATAQFHVMAVLHNPDAETKTTELYGTFECDLVRSDRRWRILRLKYDKRFAIER